jgi:hypothetical protein
MNASELQAWAMGKINADIESIIPKAMEYGAIDLEMMGVGLVEQTKVPWTNPLQAGLEMAIVFYLQGKVARCISAISAGHLPTDDTLKDIRVYAMMLAHVREFGYWRVDVENTANHAFDFPEGEPNAS